MRAVEAIDFRFAIVQHQFAGVGLDAQVVEARDAFAVDGERRDRQDGEQVLAMILEADAGVR